MRRNACERESYESPSWTMSMKFYVNITKEPYILWWTKNPGDNEWPEFFTSITLEYMKLISSRLLNARCRSTNCAAPFSPCTGSRSVLGFRGDSVTALFLPLLAIARILLRHKTKQSRARARDRDNRSPIWNRNRREGKKRNKPAKKYWVRYFQHILISTAMAQHFELANAYWQVARIHYKKNKF